MTVTINGSGTVTGITAGGLPDAIITQPEMAAGVAGTGPAFSAYGSGTQSLSATTFTKIAINTKNFDTNTNFDAATNYRFTPTVAGYYQINAALYFGNVATSVMVSIYKNGSEYLRGVQTASGSGGNNSFVAATIYFNGTTDYVEMYGYTVGAQSTQSGNNLTQFSGCMVRAA